MPIYEDLVTTRDKLYELQRHNKCKECGSRLDVFWDANSHKAFLACHDWPRTHHEGIEREASRYEMGGLSELTLEKRREIMEQRVGEAKTRALEKYQGVLSLTREEARECILAEYPGAPPEEVSRAVLLCVTQQLNPLMKHVFLIPFNKGKENETWVTVLGIKAKRLLASRADRSGKPRPYSYVDDTPKVMKEELQKTIFGEVDKSKLWVITKLKDPTTGAEAVGYGFWPIAETPKGMEKGNSKFNMAAIRSESQALDRLRPGEMPVGVAVMSEEEAEAAVAGDGEPFIEGKAKVSAESTAPDEPVKEADLGVCPIHNIPLVAGKGHFPPYCPTRVDGTGHSVGKTVWCKGVLPAGEAPRTEAPEPPPPEDDALLEEPPQTSQRKWPHLSDLGEFFTTAKNYDLTRAEVFEILEIQDASQISDLDEAWEKVALAKGFVPPVE